MTPNVNSTEELIAMHKAAFFIVQSYAQRGFGVDRTRRRLQDLMTRSLRAKLWTADQYTLAAQLYSDAIHRIYKVRLTFEPAVSWA